MHSTLLSQQKSVCAVSLHKIGFCKLLPSAEVSIIHNGNGDTPPAVY